MQGGAALTLVNRRGLPAPDRFGNYYFGKPPDCPAIFCSGTAKRPIQPGKYFASAGTGGRLLMDDAGICYFASAQEALVALEAAGAFR